VKKKIIFGLIILLLAGLVFFLLFVKRTDNNCKIKRVYLVGLDGLYWNIVDPFIERGELPVFRRLKEEGSWAKLKTINPTISPIVWTSIGTGKKPQKHGIHNWFVNDKFFNRLGIKEPFLWEILSLENKRSYVFGWWLTYPVAEINGIIISDFFFKKLWHLFEKKRPEVKDISAMVYPYDLQKKLLFKLIRKFKDGDLSYNKLLQKVDVPDYLAKFSSSQEKALDVPVLNQWPKFIFFDYLNDYLFNRFFNDQYELLAIYYRIPDVFLHFSTLFLSEKYHQKIEAIIGKKQKITPEIVREFELKISKLVLPLLKAKEKILQKIIDRVDREGGCLIVCSDHGFQLTDRGYEHTYQMPGQSPPAGFLAIYGPGVQKGKEICATVMDITPTVLYLLQQSQDTTFDGRILKEAFNFELPITYRNYHQLWKKSYLFKSGVNVETLKEQELSELKALGYIN